MHELNRYPGTLLTNRGVRLQVANTVYVPWRFAFNSTFKLFHPPHAGSQTNGTVAPICFSTGHDIRAARFNAAGGYSRTRTWLGLRHC